MRIFIFGKTQTKANVFLEHLIQEKNISSITKSSSEFVVRLFDGIEYRAISASLNSKGCRCDKVYIDKQIDLDIVYMIIEPMLFCSNLPKAQQIEYF